MSIEDQNIEASAYFYSVASALITKEDHLEIQNTTFKIKRR